MNVELVSHRTAEAAAAALPKRDPQWLEVKIGAFYGEEQPAGMSVPEFALTLVQLLQVKCQKFYYRMTIQVAPSLLLTS